MNRSINTCTSKPISWLRLEAHALDEVRDRDERARIGEHLKECAACAASLSEISSDNNTRNLPSLILPASEPALNKAVDDAMDEAPKATVASQPSGWQSVVDWLRGKNRWLVVGGGLLATTAAVMLFVRSQPGPASPDSSVEPSTNYRASVGVKGGEEFVLSLVRDRAGVVSWTPQNFSSGDRFKLSLTCTEPGALDLDVVVLQSGELHRPLGTPTIHCGNNVLVPGAFAASGQDTFEVCVAPKPNRSSPLTLTDLKDAACVWLPANTN